MKVWEKFILSKKKLSKDRETEFVRVSSYAEKKCRDLASTEDPEGWLCFASAGSRKIKKGRDLAFAGDQVLKTNVTLLLQGVNISTNLNNCDFASVRSQKIKNGQDLASVGDQVPKTNVTLLLQGVNISTNLNNCDFASEGSRKIKNDQDLASAGDQVPKQMWPCFCRGSTYQQI